MIRKSKRPVTDGAPLHIALIPDGNRRWARLHNLDLFRGYDTGIRKFIEFAKWSKEFGVKTVTVWGLSTENLKSRTGAEIKILLELYTRAAKDSTILADLRENKARLRVIGDLGGLPKRLREALAYIEDETSKYTDLTINILLNYGGREDLLYSVRELVKSGEELSEEKIKEHLRTSNLPDVDLIVRTSGEMRLSGLLPWQSAYSELYFVDKYWEDFDRKDFEKAMATFSKRQRRFGK